MRKMLLAAGAAFALAGSTNAPETQSGPYQSRDFLLANFDRIEVSGPFKVGVLVSGEPAQVRLSGPPALLADTITKVDGDTLMIRFRDGVQRSWSPGFGVNVSVSAPNLVSARAQRAAQVEIDQVRVETFSGATDGSGNIAVRGLDAGRVVLATGGSGGITAEGRARGGTYAVAGSGSIDAKRLRLETADLSIEGAGSIHADVSRIANVSLTGSGGVEVVGGATCINQPAQSTRIECR
jgi:hypothetical protein